MNPITRKTENIDGIDYSFHISTELDQKHIKGYIQLLNHEGSFRKLENPPLVLKRILYYHIYSELKKYLVVKTASIESDSEYHALFEIVDLNLKNSAVTETVQTENNQEITLSVSLLDSFANCEELVQSPFGGLSRTLFDQSSLHIMSVFSTIVLHIKVSDPTHSQNSYTAIIDKAAQTFNDKKFGKAFLLIETERMNCNPKEVQIKYTIMPYGF
ncbi:hypothetical protein [Flavobacterium piscisymbiosum]|uniref:Uncharacterized protein n=1 Tax=Flavobacterium piscisymbiosum TaxID=2893753 RepID=A0ABS8ME38_9FLAO|nr:hypothetical protein [Flavobacterium sp. F-30]MCC9063714.1 hypothetical protein [Flavobacterium sp. F-30]